MSDTASTDSTEELRTEVVVAQINDSQRARYEQLRNQLNEAARESPGLLRVSSHEGVGSQQGEFVTVLEFDTPAHLQQWRNSPHRSHLVAQIDDISPSSEQVVPTGFGQWFAVNASAQVQTPAWRQSMVMVAVLFGMVSVLDITLGNFIGKGLTVEGSEVFPGLGLPFPVVVFIGNVVSTILLTWVVMPVVTRVMSWWLDPHASKARTWQGIVLLLVIYVLEIAFFTLIFNNYGF